MTIINKARSILLLIFSCTQIVFAQDSTKLAAVKNAITNKQYSFEAQSALPQRTQVKQLTPGYYELQIKNDTIISYLPYYGRVYMVPMDINDDAIKFTSVKFNYNIQPRKRGGWLIVIKPQDADTVQELDLTVSESGYSSLTVVSTNKETISFEGLIKY